MRKVIVLAALTLVFSNAFTQSEKISFPKSFIGNWKGTLEWFLSTEKEPRKVNMELRIQPSKDTADQYTWNLIYGSATADNRPYILKAVDTAKGHWVTDEVNGIILDGYWIGNKFCSVFTVQPVTIINNCWLENGNLVVEFISMQAKPVATTGKGTEDIPFVDSYQVKSYQKAVLTKR